MSKKIIVSGVILILVLVAGGFFYWWRDNSDPYKYDASDNFTLIDVGEKKILRNEKAGLEIEVLKDWKFSTTSANFLSPDAELFENGGLKTGLWIFIEILNCSKFNALMVDRAECEEAKEIINKFHQDLSQDKQIDSYQIREINNSFGIEKKETHTLDGDRESVYITFKIPSNDKLFYINALLIPSTDDRYNQFEEFLKGIKFN